MMIRAVLLPLLAVAAIAAEPQELSAPASGPAAFRLHHLGEGSTLVLAAGSRVRLSQVDDRWTAEVIAGAAQFDLRGKGEFAAMEVRGAAARVLVTGTLFCVERVGDDADYVALIRGAVKVRLREDLAKALNRDPSAEIDLPARNGVAADGKTGLGTIEPLRTRPQLSGEAANRASVRDQAVEHPADGIDWGTDHVLARADDPALAAEALPVAANPPDRTTDSAAKNDVTLAADTSKQPAEAVLEALIERQEEPAGVRSDEQALQVQDLLDAIVPPAPPLGGFPSVPHNL